MNTELFDRISRAIDEFREELASLCVHFGNTFSPTGHEGPMADAVYEWLVQAGIPAFKQPLLEDRANVVGVIRGTPGGRRVLFNAHMDSEVSGTDFDQLMGLPDVNRQGGRREGNRLYGHTILNDRGLLATFLVMGKALQRSGVSLPGDVILTAVVGETGMAPVDEFQGLQYEGKGFGSRFLVSHGVRADYAIVAETTDWGIGWHECGAIYYKVTVRGRSIYTPRLPDLPSDVASHPNAIVKMAEVVRVIEEWGRSYTARKTYHSSNGKVVPRVNIGAVRGGLPYRPNRSASLCAAYVDVRTVPGENPDAVTRDLEQALKRLPFQVEVQPFLIRPGIEGKGVEPLVEAAAAAYRHFTGQNPPPPPTDVISMWRDLIVFNEVGIPSITFGPPRRREPETGRLYFDLDDLVLTAKLYAYMALHLMTA